MAVALVTSTADETVAEDTSTAEETVAMVTSTADEAVAMVTSTADEAVAKGASAADEAVSMVAPTVASTVDEAAAKGASMAVMSRPLPSNARRGHGLGRVHGGRGACTASSRFHFARKPIVFAPQK